MSAFGPPSSENVNIKRKRDELTDATTTAENVVEGNEEELNESNPEDSDDNGDGEENPPSKKNGKAQKKPAEKSTAHQPRTERVLL